MVLLLSSEPLVRTILKELLEGAGYMVVATGDLGSAVDSFVDHRIDLLITRPYVDDVTGHDAAKYLRSKNPHMGILVVAGLPADQRVQDRATLERFEIFPEPFPTAQFLTKVKETLKEASERFNHGQKA